jgi:Fic family protein
MDQELWTALSQADRALGRLDGSTETLPNPDLFVFMYVRKEAVLSSQIEGRQASLMDVLEFEAKAVEPGAPKDVEEVANYVSAMNHGLARLQELPVSLRLIREIHSKIENPSFYSASRFGKVVRRVPSQLGKIMGLEPKSMR